MTQSSHPVGGHTVGPVTDCGPDGGCEECDVCRYLNFLEWAGQVSGGVPSTIERNPEIEAYLRQTYPHLERVL